MDRFLGLREKDRPQVLGENEQAGKIKSPILLDPLIQDQSYSIKGESSDGNL